MTTSIFQFLFLNVKAWGFYHHKFQTSCLIQQKRKMKKIQKKKENENKKEKFEFLDFLQINWHIVCIVGPDFGLTSNRKKTTSMIDISMSWTFHDAVESRGSKISFSDMLLMKDDDEIEEIKSLGWFSFITSNASTPKLYTLHFLVTFIVLASSAQVNDENHHLDMTPINVKVITEFI